jgi:3-hydroxybutyryl-CoA dehydrogenase
VALKSKQFSQVRRQIKRKRPTVFIMGDENLVEELGRIFYDSGFTVIVKLNSSSERKHLKGFKQNSKVPRTAVCAIELTNSDKGLKKKNLEWLDRQLPAKNILLSSSVLVTLVEQSSWIRHPERIIGIGALPTLLSQKLIELTPSVKTEQSVVMKSNDLFRRIGKEVSIVQDRIGMVMPRILCMLINEAAFASMENIASPKDIDTAMKLGTNYPYGPIEWGARIGFKDVVKVLDALYEDLHEERYRTAPLLRQLVNTII